MDIYKKKILYTIEKYALDFFKDPNVIGVGLGHKIIDGYMLNMPSLTITVKNKLKPNSINFYNKIPTSINGVLTDVVDSITTFKNSKLQKAAAYPTRLTLPAYGGGSIKNALSNDNNVGTMAHVVYNIAENSISILSTLDVLCKDETLKPQKGTADSIVYPGTPYQRKIFIPPPPNKPGNSIEIAKGINFKPLLRPIKPNITNAALSYVGHIDDPETIKKVNPGVEPTRKQLKKTKDIDENDKKIFMFSASEGLTTGTVISTHTLTVLEIYSNKYYFKDQVEVNIPYAPKDRGTLGLLKSNSLINDNDSTFGMCIGGYSDKNIATFTPINTITSIFGVTLFNLS